MKHYLANEWHRAKAQKRGGRFRFVEWEAVDPEGRYLSTESQRSDPEDLYDCEWAMEIVSRALRTLGEEMAEAGKKDRFELLKGALTGDEKRSRKDIAARLDMSEGAVKVAVHRLRQRYRSLLRVAVAETVSSEADLEREMGYLVEVLRKR
jgi:RNA polymerase sigma-70 factor (ECF subfamily)